MVNLGFRTRNMDLVAKVICISICPLACLTFCLSILIGNWVVASRILLGNPYKLSPHHPLIFESIKPEGDGKYSNCPSYHCAM